MIRKIIGTIICCAFIKMHTNAQDFGIELNGGLQGIQYSVKNGQAKLLPAGSVGFNYTFRLGSGLGLLTGVTGGLYRTQITLRDGQTFTHDAVDDVGSAFQYRLKFTGYKETQRFLAAGIPLLLQYHTEGSGIQWYIDGGVKLLVPFNASTEISAQQVDLTGYYPDFNVEVSNLPQHGFGTLNNWKSTGTLKLKPTAALSASTGAIFSLSPAMSLYTGLYVDFGLTNLKDNSDTARLVTYNSNGTSGAQASSVLNATKTDRSALLSYGLQLRLSFGHSKPKPAGRSGANTQSFNTTPPGTTAQNPTAAQPQRADSAGKVTHSDTVAQTQTSPQPQKATRQTTSSVAATLSPDDADLINEPIVFGTTGERSIPELQLPHLDQLADLLKRNPNIRISIVGHYCNGDMEKETRTIGEARAKAVAKYLQKRGISRNRLNAVAAGEADPTLLSDPAANYQSRRVVIEVQ